MKGVVGSIPKQKGLLQMCFPKLRVGEAAGWEQAEMQKGQKAGQTVEVTFRETMRPTQHNKTKLVRSSHTHTPAVKTLAVVTAKVWTMWLCRS